MRFAEKKTICMLKVLLDQLTEIVFQPWGLRFNIASDAITAAVKGAGILLARQSLIRSELAEGKLMRLFDLDFPLEHGFHLVYPKENLERDDVLSFRNWIMERFAGQWKSDENYCGVFMAVVSGAKLINSLSSMTKYTERPL